MEPQSIRDLASWGIFDGHEGLYTLFGGIDQGSLLNRETESQEPIAFGVD